jgi:NADH-quinone oxidoreductase subunit M
MAGLITALILLPLAGTLVVSVAPEKYARLLAILFNAAAAAVAIMLWRNFDTATGGVQLIERHNWIPAIGAEYLVGIDGLSLLLVLLTTLLFPFALLAERTGRAFCSLMLITQSALYGTFTAQNFVLWFLFYEMSLVPSFLLIRLFGGEKRQRAATKFFLYTFLGSVAMLLAFLGIYFAKGSFDFSTLSAQAKSGLLQGNLQWLAFAGIFVGLAVKVPLFPFHTWLPDAYESAPTSVAMVLTGALSKMGVYGFIRLLLPLFPNEIRTIAPWLLSLVVCSILVGSLAAWAQNDLKRMVGYLSINHLGYCLLGAFAFIAAAPLPESAIEKQAALSGVFMQIFNHGITAAALFYFVGLLEQRRGARSLGDFGGLMQQAPVLCGWMSVIMFSSLGLPALNGFIGEFLIFKGSFGLAATYTVVALFGLLFTAVTLIRAMQLLFSGPIASACTRFPELATNESWVIVPVALLMFAIGIAPQFLFTIFNSTVVEMTRFLA